MMTDDPLFLDAEDVLEIHTTQLEVYGGGHGLRDRGLLEAAVAQPQISFGGERAREGLFAMAAAYLFHIVRDHLFEYGKERTAILAAVVFLDLNGIRIAHRSEALQALVLRVAGGGVDKAAIASELARIARIASTKQA